MQPVRPSSFQPPARLLGLWAATLFAVILLSVFLHETGHGLGAKLDGIHVSTGFNRVGMPNRAPGDPDFRTGMAGGFWTGLLGPLTTWGLAIIFTVWLHVYRKPGWGAWITGALAIANGLLRAIPMLEFLISALGGQIHLEDEVGWGVWYFVKVCRPELAALDANTLIKTQPGLFLADAGFWVPPLLSLAISLVCLALAYRRILKLWGGRLGGGARALVLAGMPVIAWFLSLPILNALDRAIRINW
jgi:hypothetical protein